MNAIHTSPQGNVKQFLRLTTTLSPAKTVLGIRKAVLDKAGVGDFAAELRRSGFEVTDRKNMRYFIKINHHVLQYWFCRFLHENSEVNYFTIGAKPVGLCSETTAILVSASEPSLASQVDLIRVSMMVTIYLENNWKNIEMIFLKGPGEEGWGDIHRQGGSGPNGEHRWGKVRQVWEAGPLLS